MGFRAMRPQGWDWLAASVIGLMVLSLIALVLVTWLDISLDPRPDTPSPSPSPSWTADPNWTLPPVTDLDLIPLGAMPSEELLATIDAAIAPFRTDPTDAED